jgi:hypothetical protein
MTRKFVVPMVLMGLVAATTACSGEESSSSTVTAPVASAVSSAVTSPATSDPEPVERPDPCDDPAPDEFLDCLRLGDVQVIGTHNSYKGPVPGPIFELLAQFDAELAAELEYDHPPLAEQLSSSGIRQIELDLFVDPVGGLFAERVGLRVAGVENDAPPELSTPGFKVLHVQDLDYASSCVTFVICLEQLRAWSDQQPGHLPIAVLVELKSEAIPDPIGAGFVVPLPIGADDLDALDAEIRSVFDADRLIVPDDVRGDAVTLESAVLDGGWPTLADSAGRFIFLMDNGGEVADLYREGRPSLEGRVLFTNAEPGRPDAAFVKVNDPLSGVDRIRELVTAGYLVRTRSDSPTVQARSGDTTQRDVALSSGAQYVSTDYPAPRGSPFSDYVVELPGGGIVRCNPVRAPAWCDDTVLASLRA